MVGRILLLEDDANLNETVQEYLQSQGHEVVAAYDGYEAQDKLYESKFDLLLLDVNTPGMDGFSLLKESRENGVVAPAVFITSLDSVEDLEKGFEVGCDDYIRKPFELKELGIRVDTLLKRSFFHASSESIVLDEHIRYDSKNFALIVNESLVQLGQKEAKLLKLFMKNMDQVVSHEVIYKHLWDYDERPSDTALRTYIKNLRKIIGKDRIVSIKKQGYRLTAQK